MNYKNLREALSSTKIVGMFIFLDTETNGTDEEDRLCHIAFKTEAGLIVNELFTVKHYLGK